MLSPTTPTPASTTQDSRPQPDPLQTSSRPLSSSRPAPPSPAESRRISTISARSSNPRTSPGGSRRGSRSSFGIGLGLTSTTPTTSGAGGATGPGSKRQSALSALSSASGNGLLSTQKEGDEDLQPTDSTAAVEYPLTPTTATAAVQSESSFEPLSTPIATASSQSSSPRPPPTTTTTATTAASSSSSSSSSTLPTTIATTPMTSTTTTTTPPPITTTTTQKQKLRRSTRVKIKIRDFAFNKQDDRYRGMGKDVPKPNRFERLNKKLGGSKKVRPESRRWSTVTTEGSEGGGGGGASSSRKSGGSSKSVGKYRDGDGYDEEDDEDEDEDDDDDDEEEEEEENDGWFKKGMGRFSWTFGISNIRKQVQQEKEEQEQRRKELERQQQQQQQQQYPSRGELDLNFVGGGEDQGESSGRSSIDEFYDAQEEHVDNDLGNSDEQHQHEQHQQQDEDQEQEQEPLHAGTYRAVFAFEPEGPTEMRLVEDQLVHVVGRGGGIGWAVVVVPKEEEGEQADRETTQAGVEVAPGVRHALVPESYLELVELD